MRSGCGPVFLAYRFEYLVAQHPHFARRADAEAYLVTGDAHYGDDNVVADGDAFAGTAAKNQHSQRLAEKIEQTRPEHLRR